MPVTLKDAMNQLSPERRRQVEARADALAAEVMTLAELRKAMKRTQKKVAADLEVGQDGVSRIEQRSDVLLSTLRKYVAAVGGELELVARFPDRPPVKIGGFSEIAPERPSKTATGRTKRATTG